MNKGLVQSASKKLSLLDIALHKCSLLQADDFEPLVFTGSFSQQSLLDVSAIQLIFDDDGEEQKLLRVFVKLGVRAVPKEEEHEKNQSSKNAENEGNTASFFTVEATYRAEYQIKKELSDDEIAEFTQYNAVHNVWPFWRMLVFTTLKQANLPTLNIPLTRIDQVQKKKKNK